MIDQCEMEQQLRFLSHTLRISTLTITFKIEKWKKIFDAISLGNR